MTNIILVPPGPSCGCDFCKEQYGLNIIGFIKRIIMRIRSRRIK